MPEGRAAGETGKSVTPIVADTAGAFRFTVFKTPFLNPRN